MRRRDLVVVRAGDRSLHPQWLDSKDRNWDLAVSYYGDYPERYAGQFDLLHRCKGSKWQGLRDFVQQHREGLGAYRYIWLPDDDLLTSSSNIDAFLDRCHEFDLALAQPALTPFSHHSWALTLQRADCVWRETNFVEVMAPCFRMPEFLLFAQTFGENSSGWGLEWVWSKIARENGDLKIGIIDATPVHHTRPVGAMGHGGAARDPHEEKRELLEKYGLTADAPVVRRAHRVPGRRPASPPFRSVLPALATRKLGYGRARLSTLVQDVGRTISHRLAGAAVGDPSGALSASSSAGLKPPRRNTR